MNPASDSAIPLKKRRTWLRLGGFIVLGLAVLATAAWAGRRWIGEQLASEANSRLEEAGVYLTWKEAYWIPGPGVTLTQVTLYRDASKTDPAVELDSLSLVKHSQGWRDWSEGRFLADRTRLKLIKGDTSMLVEDFTLDLDVKNGRVTVTKARGKMEGWDALITGEHVWKPRSQMTPEELAKLPPREKGQGLKSALRFGWLAPMQRHITVTTEGQLPVAHLDFRKAQPEDRVKMNLELSGGDFQWRGLHLTKAAAKIDTAAEGDPWSRIEVPLLELSSGGGTAELAGYIDPRKEEIIIQKLSSTLDLPSVIRQLAPGSTHLQRLKSEGDWQLTGTGSLPMGDPLAFTWEGRLTLKGHLAWTLDSGTIHLANVSADLLMKERRARLTDVEADLWGGTVKTDRLDLDYSQPGTTFQTKARLAGAKLSAVMKSFGSSDSRPGVVTGTWSGGGELSTEKVNGSGSFTIKEARFYQVPFLGALYLVINPLQPEFGRDVASDLEAVYGISNGVLTFSKLDLESRTTKISSKGTIRLATKQANFEAQARLRGLVMRLATGAFSELLSFEGTGTLPDLRWGLKLNPGTEIITGTLDTATGLVIEGAKKGAEAAGNVLEGTGKAARELLKVPGRLFPGGKN